MVALQPIFKKAYWSLVGFGAIYGVFLFSATFKSVQRQALYMHKAQSERWNNLDKPESLGFAKNQITPFYLPTPDGEELYGWHVLPIGLYSQHEDALLTHSPWPPTSFSDSLAHKLLIEDPESRIVINFHGNAGHVGQGYRPRTYKSLTSASSKIHVITVDYRGFGRSSGIPSEAGLITDGVALVNYVLSMGIPPERIIFLGQSLGTQVASAVALHFASPSDSTKFLPNATTDVNPGAVVSLQSTSQSQKPITFASVILAASFPSLSKLLKVYRLGGLVPLLSPLRVYPSIQNFVLRFIHEPWNTSLRLSALIKAASSNDLPLHLQVMHSADDYDISWRMGAENFAASVAGLQEISQTEVELSSIGEWGETIRKSAEYRGVKVDWTLLMSGGHNRLVADVPVALAVMRGFGL